jgi:hypothetical protein
MSYCRFRNTLEDLLDCEENINRQFDDMDEDEREAHDQLIKVCKRIAKQVKYEK